MKTAFQAFIESLEQNPNEVLTKANVLHHARTFLPIEKDQMVDMGNRYYKPLLKMGIITQDAETLFNKIYK